MRLTPNGFLRTCLYDESGINLKDEMRLGKTDHELKTLITSAIKHKSKDGWDAQKNAHKNPKERESMATIGG